ncbi:MAG: efflux RND transporter periplasmic adaptor subunit [Bacteroidetes bacterium]|nr:efflux RND transporter periplasmic adaptor subunit [Bacteroidota bacterium]
MNLKIKTYMLLFAASLFITSCGDSGHNEDGHDHGANEEPEHDEHDEGHDDEVHFSEQQYQSLKMKTDTLPIRNISSYVEANGQLEVPPQNEATVTAIIGSNVTLIKVIEGDKVTKGQVLAYLSHPNLITLQTDYIQNWNQLQYLEMEYQRQKKLFEEKVGSGKTFQKTQADYFSMKGLVKGYEAQLKMMGMRLDKVQQNDIYEKVPVTSPINGHVRLVEVKTGQYVQPQTEMFEIVNIDHIHADLMVFEKDMHKVKKGQQIRFTIESIASQELEAKIYSVGKAFEQDPKAIHIHAEIENKKGLLIPGMYIRGRIMINDVKSYVLPEAGVVREGEKYYIFTANKENDNGKTEWGFKPVEVSIGTKDDGWVEINLLSPLDNGEVIAWNNAYYLLAEMKKGEAEHSH